MKVSVFAQTTIAAALCALSWAPLSAQEVLLLQRAQVKAGPRPVKHKAPAKLTITRSAASLSGTAREAQRRAASGDLIGAIEQWTAELEAHPAQIEGWIARAALKRQLGDHQGAQDDLDHVLEDHPTSVQALLARSSVRRRLNDLRGAGKDIDKAANLAPHNFQVFTERSSLRFALSDMVGAIADYNYAQTLHHPSLPAANQAKASGQAQVPNSPPPPGKSAEPIRVIGTGVSHPPQLPKIVASETKIEPKDEYKAEYKSEIKSDTRYGEQHSVSSVYSPAELAHVNNAAVQEINAKHFDLAITSFERLLKLSPDYAHARDNLVIAHNNYGLELARKNAGEALKQFRAALYLDPTQASARQNLAALMREMKKNPDNAEERQKMAEDCLAAGDRKGAFIELFEALRLKNTSRLRSQLLSVLAAISENESASANREQQASVISLSNPEPTILGTLEPALDQKTNIIETEKATALMVPRNTPEVTFAVDSTSVSQVTSLAAAAPAITSPVAPAAALVPAQAAQGAPAAVPAAPVVRERPVYESPSAAPATTVYKTTIENSPETILQVARQLASENRELDAEALLMRLAEILRKKRIRAERGAEALLENTLETLSDLYLKHSRLTKAEHVLKELVEIREKSKSQDDPILGKTLADYSSVLRSVGRLEEASKQENKANYILNSVH